MEAALRSPDGVADPVALLWTDADGQWRPLLAQLRSALPQLYALGPYDPQSRTGPVIWLKCIVDRTLPDSLPPQGTIPILYLPNVDRQQLRSRRLPTAVAAPYRAAVSGGVVASAQWPGLDRRGVS